MQTSQIRPAVLAAMSSASALGLRVEDAMVLHASNRLAGRLLPCNVLARVADVLHWDRQAKFESSLPNYCRKPRARWRRLSLEWSRVCTSVTTSRPPCAPTTN